jgi:hypothetical protein
MMINKDEVMMMETMETKWRQWRQNDDNGDKRWSDDDGNEMIIMETKWW